MIKLSEYVFRFLEEKGVGHAFMLPGGGAMHLDDSLGKSSIPYTVFLHEQAAAIAAEAYGQHTNTPGLVLVTSGPGATNTITGVTAGWIDSTPMFIISGQSKRADLVGDKGVRQIGSQEVQIVPMVTPITKFAVQVLEPEKIKYYLEYAWHECVTGRPGPVWIDIPLDVQAYMLDEDALCGYVPENPVGNEISNRIDKAADDTVKLLKEAKKPLILAGNGIKLSDAIDKVYELVENYGIPVETTWKTIDMFAENHPMYVGHPGIMGDRGANKIIQEADLIISIGCRLDTSVTAFNEKNFGKNAKKIVIDIDANEIARMDVDMSVSLAADAGDYINALLQKMENVSDNVFKDTYAPWVKYCKELRVKYPVVTEEHKCMTGYVSAYYFIGELCKLLRADDVIVPESSGGAGEITYQAFCLKNGQKMKNAAGLGSMGFGLPYAIGSCIANDKRRTILINGDGAFQLNIQEMETLKRLNLPVKIFIWSNNGYASIRNMQRNNFEGHYVASEEGSGLTVPNIINVAQAYGFKTIKISDNQELDKLLPVVMQDDEPIVCELMVSPDETVSPRVKAIVGENGKMESGPLEKMWPYIE